MEIVAAIIGIIGGIACCFLLAALCCMSSGGESKSQKRSTYDGLMSQYEADVRAETARADMLNELEVMRYKAEKRAEAREMKTLVHWRDYKVKMGMDEHEANAMMLDAGFRISKVRPPQIITVC